jgi:hypothetical protein
MIDLEKLKHYFATTPKQKVLEDWEKTEALDNNGVTIDEYFKTVKLLLDVNPKSDITDVQQKQNKE